MQLCYAAYALPSLKTKPQDQAVRLLTERLVKFLELV